MSSILTSIWSGCHYKIRRFPPYLQPCSQTFCHGSFHDASTFNSLQFFYPTRIQESTPCLAQLLSQTYWQLQEVWTFWEKKPRAGLQAADSSPSWESSQSCRRIRESCCWDWRKGDDGCEGWGVWCSGDWGGHWRSCSCHPTGHSRCSGDAPWEICDPGRKLGLLPKRWVHFWCWILRHVRL